MHATCMHAKSPQSCLTLLRIESIFGYHEFEVLGVTQLYDALQLSWGSQNSKLDSEILIL